MPTYIPNSRTQTDDQGVGDMRLLSQRIRLVAAQNPYMADNLSALTQMAMSPMGTEDLFATAGQHYSMILGDKFANQLRTLTPGAQRAITSRLAPGQQQALAQMGYQEPNRDEGSFLGTAASMIGKPLSVISHGVTAIPGVGEAAHATMETLNWVGQWPAHLYRSARSASARPSVAPARRSPPTPATGSGPSTPRGTGRRRSACSRSAAPRRC